MKEVDRKKPKFPADFVAERNILTVKTVKIVLIPEKVDMKK